MASPGTPGPYKNCFLADGKASHPTSGGFSPVYTDVNPPTSVNGGAWGDCAAFSGETSHRPAHLCLPPLVPGAVSGECICPQGTVLRDKECVKQTTCQPPMVPGPIAGQCICPPPTHLVGNKCEGPPPPPTCQPPMVPGPVAGQCICPPPSVLKGKECVRPIECRSPLIPNASGTACGCPAGLEQHGRECVKPTVCNPPAKLNRRGDCECPTDMVAKGNSCVERERKPQISPGDIIRNIPGGGRDNPAGPRGGRDTDNPRGGRDNDGPRGGGQGPTDLPGRR
jgi:hypothetical protein